MDNEFLLYLNSEIITDDYSDKFINSILKFIKDYCKADLVMLIDLESQRKDDFKYMIKVFKRKMEILWFA